MTKEELSSKEQFLPFTKGININFLKNAYILFLTKPHHSLKLGTPPGHK